MNNTPNPIVGEEIEVVVKYDPEVKVKTKVLRVGPLVNTPQFNHWVVKLGKQVTKVSWNPMLQAFFAPDYTD